MATTIIPPNPLAIIDDEYLDKSSPAAFGLALISAFSLLFCIPPLIWHSKSRNMAPISLILWAIYDQLTSFINAIVWPDDAFETWFSGIIYCDITTKLDIASNLGVLGALACVLRGLASALDTRKTRVTTTREERRRRLVIDILFCLLAPAWLIAIHYIVQPFRYYVVGIAGCAPALSPAWLTILLIYAPLLGFCLVDVYLCLLLVYRMHRYRMEFSAILSASSSGMNKNRFMRLFILAILFLAIYAPLQVYLFIISIASGVTSYSWIEVHSDWNQVQYLPSYGQVPPDKWIRATIGFMVFACFGLGREAQEMYRTWLVYLAFDEIFPQLRKEGVLGSHGSRTLGSGSGSSWTSKLKNAFGRRFSMSTTKRSVGTLSTSSQGPRSPIHPHCSPFGDRLLSDSLELNQVKTKNSSVSSTVFNGNDELDNINLRSTPSNAIPASVVPQPRKPPNQPWTLIENWFKRKPEKANDLESQAAGKVQPPSSIY